MTINQSNKVVGIKVKNEGQFQYMDRWVDKANFRAFVYNQKGHQTLANSYNEFESLIASGLWFAKKPDASKERKQKNGNVC